MQYEEQDSVLVAELSEAPIPDAERGVPTETIFVSYNGDDARWAEWVAWHIEASGCRAILQAWDFRPGSNFVLAMQQAASESDRTIAIVSPAYLNSQFTQPEWAAAFRKDPRGRKRALIPLVVEPCDSGGLLAGIVYVDISGVGAQEARKRLLSALSADRPKPKSAPRFPGRQTATTPSPEFPGCSATITPCPATESCEFEEFPPFLLGLTAGRARAKIRVAEASSLRMDFDQSNFHVLTKSPYARQDFNPFEFKFPAPGVYNLDFEVSAKETKDLNGLVTVTATGSKVLLRRTYRISALTLKKETVPTALARLFESFLLRWKSLLLGFGAALLVVGIILLILASRGYLQVASHAPALAPATPGASSNTTETAAVWEEKPPAQPTGNAQGSEQPKSEPKKRKSFSSRTTAREDSKSKAVAVSQPPGRVTDFESAPAAFRFARPPLGAVGQNGWAFRVNPPSLPVPGAPARLRLAAAGLLAVKIGERFSKALTVEGGSDLREWNATGLPDGVTINPETGEITGAPAEAGVFSVSVSVTDRISSDQGLFRLSVVPLAAVFVHLPESPGPSAPVLRTMESCLAKFFTVQEDNPAAAPLSLWCTKCATDEVKFELWKTKPNGEPRRTGDLLWSDSFPADENHSYDLDLAMKHLCYGRLGIKKAYDSITQKLTGGTK